ncbi:nedd8-conjugating enzyme ube2f [Plakobranchus ocellatus]|uniref:Nedd8-conjugating enzyme ube2f n=1 Tax=Plakobranchus ocellatus TaxID=259542 RepID=A0AAV3Z4T6_9GAST|nr:nedd8-conjugating enzyme ube2f [Plakobranchus ocellatus]
MSERDPGVTCTSERNSVPCSKRRRQHQQERSGHQTAFVGYGHNSGQSRWHRGRINCCAGQAAVELKTFSWEGCCVFPSGQEGIREVQEMEELLTETCEVAFPDPSCLHQFILTVTPDSGYWQGGRFRFAVSVPEDYNIVPPKVICQTQLYHPNINETGEVCLSLLRESSYDSMGIFQTKGERFCTAVCQKMMTPELLVSAAECDPRGDSDNNGFSYNQCRHLLVA